MPLPSSINKFIPYMLLTIAPLLWAGNFVMGRLMHGQIPPFTFACYRWALVLLLLLPFVYKDLLHHKEAIRKHWIFLAILGFLGIMVYTSFVYWSLNYTSVINAALINATIPAFILIISWAFFQGTVSMRQLLGIIFSLVGVAIIVSRGQLSVLLGLGFDRGELIVLFAALCWALYSILLNHLPTKLPRLLFLFVIGVFGEILLIPPFLIEFFSGHTMLVTPMSVCGLLYTVFFASVLAYTCWGTGVANVGAHIAGHFYNLLSVFGAILAILFLGETFHLFHLIGILFVFAGIFLATFKARGRHYCPSGCPSKSQTI